MSLARLKLYEAKYKLRPENTLSRRALQGIKSLSPYLFYPRKTVKKNYALLISLLRNIWVRVVTLMCRLVT